jgi:hypothetical protein
LLANLRSLNRYDPTETSGDVVRKESGLKEIALNREDVQSSQLAQPTTHSPIQKERRFSPGSHIYSSMMDWIRMYCKWMPWKVSRRNVDTRGCAFVLVCLSFTKTRKNSEFI